LLEEKMAANQSCCSCCSFYSYSSC